MADVATIKSGVAWLGAAALWKQISEILALPHLLGVVWVLLTHQLHPSAQQTSLVHVVQNLFPENRFAAKLGKVSNAIESMTCS